MKSVVIYLDPEISMDDINKLAVSNGLRLAQDQCGRYFLARHPQALLPNGARYVNSTATDIRPTLERARAQLSALHDG